MTNAQSEVSFLAGMEREGLVCETTIEVADLPPDVRAALYARIPTADCGTSLAAIFCIFPDVWNRLLTAQIVARGLYTDPWAPWVIDSLIDDIRRAQLASWTPRHVPN